MGGDRAFGAQTGGWVSASVCASLSPGPCFFLCVSVSLPSSLSVFFSFRLRLSFSFYLRSACLRPSVCTGVHFCPSLCFLFVSRLLPPPLSLSLAPCTSLSTPPTPLLLVSASLPYPLGCRASRPRPRSPRVPVTLCRPPVRSPGPCRRLRECTRFGLQMRETQAAVALALVNPFQATVHRHSLSGG